MRAYRVKMGEGITAYFTKSPTISDMKRFLAEEIARHASDDFAGAYSVECGECLLTLTKEPSKWINLSHPGLQGNLFMMVETIEIVEN